MMLRLLLVLVFALRLIAVAADPAADAQKALDPLLAPHATQYTTELEALRAERAKQTTEAETQYAEKLDALIAGAKDEGTIALLRKEREGVVKGFLPGSRADDLPEEAEQARKAFLNGAGKAVADYTAAKKKLDAAYLKTLADLAKKARSKNSPAGLSAQVAAEKRRVSSSD